MEEDSLPLLIEKAHSGVTTTQQFLVSGESTLRCDISPRSSLIEQYVTAISKACTETVESCYFIRILGIIPGKLDNVWETFSSQTLVPRCVISQQ